MSRLAPLLLALSLAAPLLAQGRAPLRLTDLSESGEAIRAEALPGGALLSLGPAATWDLVDLEVRGATPGAPLRFRVAEPERLGERLAPAVLVGTTWSPVLAVESDGDGLVLELSAPRERFVLRLAAPPTDPVARAPYYAYDRHLAYLEQVRTSPLAEVTEIGASLLGRPLHRIVIDDPAVGGEKKTVLMVVRQHGDEWGSSYLLEGVLDLLLDRVPPSASSLVPQVLGPIAGATTTPGPRPARALRWVIYPLANPDGAVLSQRYNANGVDLNRDWESAGCHAGQEPETFAIQCDVEALQATYGFAIAGDHHGWTNGNHGGYRYANGASVSFVSPPEYREARKDTEVIALHDPTQTAWQENGGVVGMMRAELFQRFGLLVHTPEYDSRISTPEEFREKGRGWVRAMADTLQAVRFTDAEDRTRRFALLGTSTHLAVDDLDEDLAPGVVESVSVTVFDPASGDVEVLALDETGPGTGRFRTAAPLPLVAGAPVPGDGVLQTSSGARCVARYRDADHAPDASAAFLVVR